MNAVVHPDSQARIAELGFERLSLAIPLADLHSLEPVLDVVFAGTGGGNASILVGGEPCPVFCLSDELKFESRPRPGRRICAIVDGGDAVFGLICSAVVATPAGSNVAFDIPACMRSASSPLEALELVGDRVLYRTSGASLGEFVARRRVAFHE
jgi:hypothetical protein